MLQEDRRYRMMINVCCIWRNLFAGFCFVSDEEVDFEQRHFARFTPYPGAQALISACMHRKMFLSWREKWA